MSEPGSRVWGCVRFGVAFSLLLLVGCDEAPSDPIDSARDTIASAPNDPAPRVALARIYLEHGRGDLAEALIDQAIERGADPDQLLPERAEALPADTFTWDRPLAENDASNGVPSPGRAVSATGPTSARPANP